MKKFKVFLSLLKERDWLEEMAAQGWLLTNMTWGVIYDFKKAEPCQKVYEIDRFAVTSHATVKELNARKFAIDVATQSGWEVVTNDEEMNYYFMKDKAGDETDEFYDDEESRRERAERYRKHYAFHKTLVMLSQWLGISFLFLLVALLLPGHATTTDARLHFLTIYIGITIVELICGIEQIKQGQSWYNELSLSREEWEKRKKFGVKRKFKRVQHLRSFLQEQSESGLSLTGYEDATYLFEEDSQRYNYFVDTKKCLRKRLKEQGIRYKDDLKDVMAQSLKWYEMSIANAEQYGLKPVGVIDRNILIYKRPYSDEELPWENGNERISKWQQVTLVGAIIMGSAFLAGFIVGIMM